MQNRERERECLEVIIIISSDVFFFSFLEGDFEFIEWGKSWRVGLLLPHQHIVGWVTGEQEGNVLGALEYKTCFTLQSEDWWRILWIMEFMKIIELGYFKRRYRDTNKEKIYSTSY